jgi:hypothetical protein
MLACVLFPLPGTPMITYFRMQSPSHIAPATSPRRC